MAARFDKRAARELREVRRALKHKGGKNLYVKEKLNRLVAKESLFEGELEARKSIYAPTDGLEKLKNDHNRFFSMQNRKRESEKK